MPPAVREIGVIGGQPPGCVGEVGYRSAKTFGELEGGFLVMTGQIVLACPSVQSGKTVADQFVGRPMGGRAVGEGVTKRTKWTRPADNFGRLNIGFQLRFAAKK